MRPPSAEFKTTGPFGVDTTSDLAEDADLAAILKNNGNCRDYYLVVKKLTVVDEVLVIQRILSKH